MYVSFASFPGSLRLELRIGIGVEVCVSFVRLSP